MRRVLFALALVATLTSTTSLPVQAGPHEYHTCPSEARGTVTHDGDASWVATTQSSRLVGTRVAPIGGIVALVCVYQMFGGEYWIYKRPSPEYVACRAEARGFYCGAT